MRNKPCYWHHSWRSETSRLPSHDRAQQRRDDAQHETPILEAATTPLERVS